MTTKTKPPRYQHSPENDGKILALYHTGASNLVIAREMGCSKFAVKCALDRMGHKRKGCGSEVAELRIERPAHWPKAAEPHIEAVLAAVDVADLEHGGRLLATGRDYAGTGAASQRTIRRLQAKVAEREGAQ